MSGLASLTANYTDSEDEDANKNDTISDLDEDDDEKTGEPSSRSGTGTPNGSDGSKSTPTAKKLALVSYDANVDDDDEDDETNNVDSDKNAEPVPMDLESDSSEKDEKAAPGEILNRSGSTVEVDAWTEGGRLPPEPQGLCAPSIQESVNRAMRKKNEFGYDMNAVIQNKKAFRNPSIYEKLIEYCEIDEHGTNFPKDLYDGHLFGKESYYDELAKVQKADMERREKAAKERSKNAAAAAGDPESGPKRKSKWDQVGAQGPAAAAPAKAIPAFGMLKKH